ncbi:MAG: restriction endonuclease subunit S, partial [Sphaerospermopsis kisseleviana]
MNTSTIRFQPIDENIIIIDFLHYCLGSIFFKSQIIRLITGAAQPNFGPHHLKQVQIPLPPLDEQKRIAAILNEKMEAVEKARESAIAQLEAAKALTAAYLRSVFNSPEAQTWEIKTLEEVCESSQYGTSEASNDQDDGLPVLRMGNISEGRIIWQNLKYINLSETEKNKYKLKKGDIL